MIYYQNIKGDPMIEYTVLRMSKDLRDSLKIEAAYRKKPMSKLLEEFVNKLKAERVGKES